MVGKILAAKRKDKEADTRELESKIDALVYGAFRLEPAEVKIVKLNSGMRQINRNVYALYDLTPEEIATVEGAAK